MPYDQGVFRYMEAGGLAYLRVGPARRLLNSWDLSDILYYFLEKGVGPKHIEVFTAFSLPHSKPNDMPLS